MVQNARPVLTYLTSVQISNSEKEHSLHNSEDKFLFGMKLLKQQEKKSDLRTWTFPFNKVRIPFSKHCPSCPHRNSRAWKRWRQALTDCWLPWHLAEARINHTIFDQEKLGCLGKDQQRLERQFYLQLDKAQIQNILPLFLSFTNKTRNTFSSVAYWKALFSTRVLHLVGSTAGEKDLWTWVSAQRNLQCQFPLFKSISFLSCVFPRHVFFLCLCTMTSSVLFPTLPTQQHFPFYVLFFHLSSPSPPPNVLLLHQDGKAQPQGKKERS